MDKSKAIVLFDGVCNLCNSSVNFIIDRDKAQYFKFAALQSESGRKLLSQFNLPEHQYQSIILIQKDHIYDRSSAALRICKSLRGIWPLLYALIIIPEFLRDPFYDFIAHNRYRWFGRTDSCRVPTKELANRFI